MERLGDWRWTVDYYSDLVWLRKVHEHFESENAPSFQALVEFLQRNRSFIRTSLDVKNEVKESDGGI